jgi:hypothetical protein
MRAPESFRNREASAQRDRTEAQPTNQPTIFNHHRPDYPSPILPTAKYDGMNRTLDEVFYDLACVECD